MEIGIPKEIKNHEYRVGGTPAMAAAFVAAGHKVRVQKGAGAAIGFSDAAYESAGAVMVEGPEQVYEAEMIIKVKEPQPSEYPLLKREQILYCYLHLAPDPVQTENLLKAGVVGIAYETVIDRYGRLPLLTPMSEIAGRLSIQAGATALHMAVGGRGVLLGGIPGVCPGKVLVIGGGVVGTNAARMAMGLGAQVTILDRSLDRLRELDNMWGPRLNTLYSTPQLLDEMLVNADLVVGAVLIPGKTAPKLIQEDHLKRMKQGSVIVDVSIDQGGCADTSRPTTHADPTYVEHGVVHYCVANMPGAVARSATLGLTNATLSDGLNIANKGYKRALLDDPYLLPGLNVYCGKVTNQHVANDLEYDYYPAEEVLN